MNARTLIATASLTLAIPALPVHAAAMARGTAPCLVSQLRSSAQLQGAAGSRDGAIVLSNRGRHACRLRGRAVVTLTDASARILKVRVYADPAVADTGTGAAAQQRRDGILVPGGRAFIAIRWGNWCGAKIKLPVRAIVHLPGRSRSIVVPLGSAGSGTAYPLYPPPCNGPGLPSTLDVRPIQIVSNSAPLP